MAERLTMEAMMERGAGRPAPEAVARLYREAFALHGSRALWSRRPSESPTIAQALMVAQGLRREGDMGTRPLALRIEEACRAALQAAERAPGRRGGHWPSSPDIAGAMILRDQEPAP